MAVNHTPSGAASAIGQNLSASCPGQRVRPVVDLRGYGLLGTADTGRLLVFREENGPDIRVYNLPVGAELANDDPDFPRFVIENNHLIDLDMEERFEMRFVEVV